MLIMRGFARFFGGGISVLMLFFPARCWFAAYSRFAFAASSEFCRLQGRNSVPPRAEAANAEVSGSCPTSQSR
jgi:hypothetical protein